MTTEASVTHLSDFTDVTHLTNLTRLAFSARNNSHCPYSKSAMGAIAVSDIGLHTGSLFETVSFMSFTAIATSLTNAISCGARQIKLCVCVGCEVSQFAEVCGLSRQSLSEWGGVKVMCARIRKASEVSEAELAQCGRVGANDVVDWKELFIEGSLTSLASGRVQVYREGALRVERSRGDE
eukprot:GHVN01048330.1.p1 GENE.GHVN01048330.1~~GHVN01048330.1.p1  ORF type:complete len:181 (+),score=60.19 GHVN01048330.1:83-625(+)